ncbi:MAG: hypothetical protein ABSG33_00425 [Candidatus Bathyarchaeia archaeon]|jgi:predicted house-cleaning noncanonical NTP pyrophosphatase (MazG superfamily)
MTTFKAFSSGRTARQLLEEARKEEFVQDKKLEELAKKYLKRQQSHHLHG